MCIDNAFSSLRKQRWFQVLSLTHQAQPPNGNAEGMGMAVTARGAPDLVAHLDWLNNETLHATRCLPFLKFHY